MNRRGFTIVELLIVITVMGILLTLAVVNLRDSQINGRDAERKADIESIATHLESFYNSGTNNSSVIGRYPSTALISSDASHLIEVLRDADIKSFIAPNTEDNDNDHNEHAVATFIAADCLGATCTQTTAGVNPQPTINTYVYQPLQSDGSLCTTESQECRSYNLFYMLELDQSIVMVKSKNR